MKNGFIKVYDNVFNSSKRIKFSEITKKQDKLIFDLKKILLINIIKEKVYFGLDISYLVGKPVNYFSEEFLNRELKSLTKRFNK